MHYRGKLSVLVWISLVPLTAPAASIHPAYTSPGISLLRSDFASGAISSQQLLSQEFYYVFDRTKLDARYRTARDLPPECATPIVIEYERERNKLSPSMRNELDSYLAPNSTQSGGTLTYVSPSGLFELDYDTSGVNAVPSYDNNSNGIPDYIEQIAGYCDYSWHLMVDSLGYLPPRTEDGRYRIEFQNMFAAGYTIRDPNDSECTITVLNNNLVAFGREYGDDEDSMETAKVTVAHELKHAVQYAYSHWRDRQWFLELDATWMEGIAYDSLRDYYSFLSTSQITEPGGSFSEGMGYGNCIWMHYLTQTYGVQINRKIWEIESSRKNAVFSDTTHYDIFNEALSRYGSSLDSAIDEYFVWNYFCGANATSLVRSYKDAASYPTSEVCADILNLPYEGQGSGRQELSANFIRIHGNGSSDRFEIKLTFGDSYNNVVLVLKYANGTYDIKHLTQSGDSVDYVSTHSLKDIDDMILIPVAISSPIDDYDYTYQIDLLPQTPSANDTKKPAISIKDPVTELNAGSFPYQLIADISDNAGIDSAYVEYKFNNDSARSSSLSRSKDGTYRGYIYMDSSTPNGCNELQFRVIAVDSATPGNVGIYPAEGYCDVRIDGGSQVTSISRGNVIPTEFSLSQNYPNPFNPATTIRYGVPEESSVVIKVYNVLGQEVRTLFSGTRSAGYYEEVFNAGELPSGIYLYMIKARSVFSNKEHMAVRKMVLLK